MSSPGPQHVTLIDEDAPAEHEHRDAELREPLSGRSLVDAADERRHLAESQEGWHHKRYSGTSTEAGRPTGSHSPSTVSPRSHGGRVSITKCCGLGASGGRKSRFSNRAWRS